MTDLNKTKLASILVEFLGFQHFKTIKKLKCCIDCYFPPRNNLAVFYSYLMHIKHIF